MFCLLCGAYYFRSSWQLRDFDRGLPTLTDLERYRADAVAHFAVHGENQDDAEIYYKTIILSYYIEGATVNTVNNDKRGSLLVFISKLRYAHYDPIGFVFHSFLHSSAGAEPV